MKNWKAALALAPSLALMSTVGMAAGGAGPEISAQSSTSNVGSGADTSSGASADGDKEGAETSAQSSIPNVEQLGKELARGAAEVLSGGEPENRPVLQSH